MQSGHSALHYLCTTRSTPNPPGKHYDHIEEPLIKCLVDAKADIDRESNEYGLTPLMYAIMVDNAKEEPQQVPPLDIYLSI